MARASDLKEDEIWHAETRRELQSATEIAALGETRRRACSTSPPLRQQLANGPAGPHVLWAAFQVRQRLRFRDA